MKILVVGSGGREHAIVHSITQSITAHEIYIAPGNAGTARLGKNVSISAEAVEDLLQFVLQESFDLVIIGPEGPLVLGLADRLRDVGVSVVGPSAAAARLEGSKAFAKAFMLRHGIPTAAFKTFGRTNLAEALEYVREEGAPIVVKASGLAAGKGAIVCGTEEEAIESVRSILDHGSLGSAGEEIVLESFMKGEEASLFVFTDGQDYVLLPTAQDHKQIGEGDTGPNTGGMGAYAPAPLMTPELLDIACRTIVEPTLHGMRVEGHAFSGILYCGLMITEEGPKVVEYNCRLGDPEAQVVLPLLASDSVELFDRLANGKLGDYSILLKSDSAACVVLSSEGYPGAYKKGRPIHGLKEAEALSNVIVYQAGVNEMSAGEPTTAGGRVLAVTGIGRDLGEAVDTAYLGVHCISFEGQYYRKDIGEKGLARAGNL